MNAEFNINFQPFLKNESRVRPRVCGHQSEIIGVWYCQVKLTNDDDEDDADDIARLENSFVVTSGRVLDIESKIAYKENYLRCSLSIFDEN